MTALSDQTQNTNFLNPLNFQFQLKRAPNINFFIQKCNIPSLTLPDIEIPSPLHPIPWAGNKIVYGDLTITFKVDENMQNYMEIYNWITSLGYTEDFSQYAAIAAQPIQGGNGLWSDVTLLVLNATQLPNIIFTMTDAFPIELSEAVVDTTPGTVNYVTATATFKYLDMFVTNYL